ncbi:hypothetical protein HELRODRAFT_164168 [Helobdella robusta]|uniref:Uncharacterized protein n=1 Tax=Helobdella robusta TaxID=6412 RepID=T1EV12_HELRO|nr:hypothetical protein HELRODRAFT_164168 [Helobdella robusta]ESN94341.1 hypothetical protein HELRODRAFT_164168 [Helobdella robusta]
MNLKKIKINTSSDRGSKKDEYFKLKRFKPVVKSVFFVRSLVKGLKDDLIEELSINDIQVFTFFPYISKKSDEHKNEEHENKDQATAFRVFIDKEDTDKMRKPEIFPSQVVALYKNRNDKRGGGVGMFIKHDIKYVVNDDSAFDYENIDVLCVNIETGHASSRGYGTQITFFLIN